MKRTLRDAATAVGGQLAGADQPYGAVATDSRTLKPGALFVALRGPNFDGRDFVAAAAANGAVGAVVDRPVSHPLPQIVVPDALGALQELGRANPTSSATSPMRFAPISITALRCAASRRSSVKGTPM